MNTKDYSMRRQDRRLTEEQAWEIIDQAPFAVVSTTDSEDFPYGVPVNPVRLDGYVYFHSTSGKSRRCDNIEANAHVALTFVLQSCVVPDEYANNFVSAMLEGDCKEITDQEEKVRVFKAMLARWMPQNSHERNANHIQ